MNVIQVGVGKMGQHWLNVLAASPHANLTGIVEPVATLREAAAAKAGLDANAAFASLDDALAHGSFDAAVVVTPPPTHRPIAEQILRAGKHVLLEKPLATTLEDAHALVDVAAGTDRVLMVAQNYRYSTSFRTVRDLVGSGAIGPLRSVSIRFERDARTMFGDGDFRYSMEDVLLVDMSIHHMDMLRAITGGRASRVYAQSWHIPQGHFAHHPAAAVLLMLDDGVPVTYTGNWATNAPETSWNGDWEIVGEEGRIAWTDTRDGSPRVMLQRWDGDPAPVEPVALAETGQAGLLADFGHAVRTGTVPDTAAADNIHSLAIVFAAVASARSGQVVEPGISGDGPAGAHGGL